MAFAMAQFGDNSKRQSLVAYAVPIMFCHLSAAADYEQ